MSVFRRREIDRNTLFSLLFRACAANFLHFHFLVWILVFHGIPGIRNMTFSLPRKNDFGVFFSSLQEQGFYAAKTGSCCIKHTLLFAPTQINSFRRTICYSLERYVFKAMKYRLIACCKVTTSYIQSH